MHTRARQCPLGGSDLNSMNTPMGPELIAMFVLKGEKEVEKEKKREKEREIYSRCHYGQLDEDICSMPSGHQSCDKTQDGVAGLGNEMWKYYAIQ